MTGIAHRPHPSERAEAHRGREAAEQAAERAAGARRPAATPTLTVRDVPPRAAYALERAGVHPLLARLYAARGVHSADDLAEGLERLLPPDAMKGCREAGALLAEAILARRRLCVVADYDCDGATACAVALRGLKLLGADPATLRHVVPDRVRHGYGLTPAIVDLALATHADAPPELLITVDNGIASEAGVAHANALGLQVLITDHHLPALGEDGSARLPAAAVIVNPNQPGCGFASKAIAGVGVMFYVLLAARAALRQHGAFDAGAQPRLDTLLDLVALGTVADVVKLDDNNRRLVAQGLKRIRAGRMQPGLAALFRAAGRDPAKASAFDLGFALGPRVNAAGRLADMGLGIACLTTDEPAQAQPLAEQLDQVNQQRRSVEADMRLAAEAQLEALEVEGVDAAPPPALVLFDEDFHEGVVGIVAGRLKDRLHRPTFVFARGADGLLKGSGRSIAGFHLRDALDLVAKRHPGLLKRFGGHAMAAGCTLADQGLPVFAQALQQVAEQGLPPEALARTLCTDGPIAAEWFNPGTVATLEAQVWGQGFPPPVFADQVQVLQQRLVADKHLKLRVRAAGLGAAVQDAIWFGRTEPLPERVRLAFRLSINEFQGRVQVQMVVEGAEAI